MNKFTQFLFFLCASFVVAHYDCVPDWRAREIVTTFEGLFADGNVRKIKDTLTSDVTLYSDSQQFATANHTPVAGAPVIKGRADFISQNKPNPGAPNGFVTLDMFHTCTKVTFRWVSPDGFGGGKYPVRGIDVLELAKEGGRWKIKTDYSEWNNVAFLAGHGYCTLC